MFMRVNMIHAVARRAGAAVARTEFHFRIRTIGYAAHGATVEWLITGFRRVLNHFAVTVADAIDNIPAEEQKKIQHGGYDNNPLRPVAVQEHPAITGVT